MDWQIIFVIATLVSLFLGMIGMVLKISKGYRNDLDENVKLLFKRFDAHKEDMDKKLEWRTEMHDRKYMRLDNCVLIQAGFTREMEYIKKEITQIHQKLDMLIEDKLHASSS